MPTLTFYDGWVTLPIHSMMETYTKEDIARVLDSTSRTISEDSRFLTKEGYISPIQIQGEANQYTEVDLDIFRQLRKHCEENNNRKSFLPVMKTELVAVNSEEISRHEKPINTLTSYEFFGDIYREFSRTDPFYDYEILQRAANKSWCLPTSKLAVIINKNSSSFSGLSRFNHQGFEIVRQPKKERNSYLWSINANL